MEKQVSWPTKTRR